MIPRLPVRLPSHKPASSQVDMPALSTDGAPRAGVYFGPCMPLNTDLVPLHADDHCYRLRPESVAAGLDPRGADRHPEGHVKGSAGTDLVAPAIGRSIGCSIDT